MILNEKTVRSLKTSQLLRARASCLDALNVKTPCGDSEVWRACQIALPLLMAELKSRGVK